MRPLLAVLAAAAVAAVPALSSVAAPAALTTGVPVAAPTTAAPAAPGSADRLRWDRVDVGTDQGLRGLDALGRRVAWVGGSDGGVWRTLDGGRTWRDVSPAGSDGLLFRDVEISDRRVVQVLAIGEGEDSRIYRTTDGGRSWTETFRNPEPDAFYDCMAMWPGGRHGLAMSDPVDGRFRIIRTRDGGRTWTRVSPAGMPPAVDGEFGFAASGTCLVTAWRRYAFLASGGGAARIFRSDDRGRTWTVRPSTLPASESGGVFSLAFRNPWRGLAVGGDFLAENDGVDRSAVTRTSGRRWVNGGDLGGYRSGVSWVAGDRDLAVAVGPTGSDVTRDGGRTWRTFSATGFDSVLCTRDRTCWASGSEGRVARLRR